MWSPPPLYSIDICYMYLLNSSFDIGSYTMKHIYFKLKSNKEQVNNKDSKNE